MDKGIVADDDQVLEAVEKGNMVRRDARLEQSKELGITGIAIFLLADAVAQNGLAPTDLDEERERFQITGKCPQKHFFMIAKNKSAAITLRLQLASSLDDLRGCWAAVDEIAKENDLCLRGAASRIVHRDVGEQAVK